MTNHIYTVEYSSRDFDEMLEMLQDNGITHLVDIRSFPSSRKVLHEHAHVQDGRFTYPPKA